MNLNDICGLQHYPVRANTFADDLPDGHTHGSLQPVGYVTVLAKVDVKVDAKVVLHIHPYLLQNAPSTHPALVNDSSVQHMHMCLCISMRYSL